MIDQHRNYGIGTMGTTSVYSHRMDGFADLVKDYQTALRLYRYTQKPITQ